MSKNILNRICLPFDNIEINFILRLTAEQRMRSHQRIELDNQQVIYLRLPRGTILKTGDILAGENTNNNYQIFAKIEAKLEPVITVTATNNLDLIKAAYHLGNRHIPLEIKPNYLRLNPDTILEKMLIQLGLNVTQETQPFYPEIGAYHQH